MAGGPDISAGTAGAAGVAGGLSALADGQEVRGCFLLLKKQLATSRNGKVYGNLRLGDAGGEVEAKLWERAEELLDSLNPGQVVRVEGRAESYQGRQQVVVNHLAAAPDGPEACSLMPMSPIPASELWKSLEKARRQVKQKHLKRLLAAFFDDPLFRKAFEAAPAAKRAHHAYVHGLLEHTSSVAGLALVLGGYYPNLDRDLLVTGALLHDVGKVEELTLGPPMDFTDAGRLEGHVALGARMLDERLARLKGFPPAAAGHLRHMILSHHGEYAFGSPKKPKFPEALVLHQADDLDAKLFMFREAREAAQAGDGNWSPFNRLLERVVYTGPSPWDQEEEPVGDLNGDSREATPQAGLFGMTPRGEDPA